MFLNPNVMLKSQGLYIYVLIITFLYISTNSQGATPKQLPTKTIDQKLEGDLPESEVYKVKENFITDVYLQILLTCKHFYIYLFQTGLVTPKKKPRKQLHPKKTPPKEQQTKEQITPPQKETPEQVNNTLICIFTTNCQIYMYCYSKCYYTISIQDIFPSYRKFLQLGHHPHISGEVKGPNLRINLRGPK